METAVYANVDPQNLTDVLIASPAMTNRPPVDSALAKVRYKVTERYAGMKSSDPSRNMER
jgi:hypothetical protein